MGICKNMKALGEYDFYSPDYEVFIKTLGGIFKTNFKITYKEYCFDQYNIETENELFDFGSENCLTMSISYCKYDEQKPSVKENIYPTYCLTFPVSLEYTKSLDLEFMPNGIFEFDDVPFSGHWKFFIEDIQGDGQGSGYKFIKYILDVRDCYINILKSINCLEVIIWTDAYYKTEEEILFCPIPQTKHTLLEIKNYMTNLDGIKFYRFIDALSRRVEIKRQTDYYTNVAFIDYFQDIY